MKSNEKNYAFIDGNNLYRGAESQNISIDYGKLRLYLRNALRVKKAFLFIGYIPANTALYNQLQTAGFTLVFKPTVQCYENGEHQIKGNVDAELVLHASSIEYKNYDKAVIISSDGDFACLIDFLAKQDKLEKIIAPTESYSQLLRPYAEYILPLGLIKKSISLKKPKNRHSRSVQEP